MKIINKDFVQINEQHYDDFYSKVNINGILNAINNFDNFFNDAITTDTSWVAFYKNNFQHQLKGKKVLELGCGDCTNAAVMAKLGAKVFANDISSVPGKIITQINDNIKFDYPIQFIEGDFLKSDFKENDFDYVVGKAFLHHLPEDIEIEFIKKTVLLLKKDGEARFTEPAINSKWLDNLRYAIPVTGRPSSLQRKAFKKWKDSDPHPPRDDSSKHFYELGKKYFDSVVLIPIGSIEKFHRLLPNGKWNRKFRRFAYKVESILPKSFNYYFARSQTIIYKVPKK